MSVRIGVTAFVDGLREAGRAELRPYIWLPAATSLLVICTGLYLGLGYLSAATEALLATLPDWLGFLSWILTPLVYLLGVLAGAWLFALLATLLASPFLGSLSIALERLRFADPPSVETGLWTDISNSLSRELRKLLYHLPRAVAVLLLTLIPVVNAVAPLIWLLFGAWTMAVQFADYPTENRQRPFRDTLSLLRSNRAAALLFGLLSTGVLMIPLLNFLMIPVCVAGGTLLWRALSEPTAGGGQHAPAEAVSRPQP